jgi:Zn-dependent metalloprotease
MKSFKLFSILLLLSTGSSANAQKFVESIRYDRDKSVPSLVVLPEKQKSKFPRITKESEQIEQTKDVLKQVLSLDENTTLELQDKSTDFNDNQHISFYQYYKGRKVDNIRSIVHYKNGQAESVNGNFCTIKDISETPVLEESQALQYALSYTGAKRYMWEDAGNEQWIKAEQENPLATFSPKGELVIYINKDDVPILTYKFDIYASAPLSRNYVYVNAENGTIEGVSSLINDIQGVAATRYSGTRNIETQFYNGTYRLQDLSRGNGIKTFNLFGQINYGNIDYTDNNWTATEWNNINKDNAALDAHWGASVVYDYFKQKHNRNSYNNLNSPLLNYVNADLYELYIDGNNHRYLDSDNAFWDGTRMTLCYICL